MKSFSYYFVEKKYDELNKRKTSAAVRTDGPIRVNSIGILVMEDGFVTNHVRTDYYLMYVTEGSLSVTINGEDFVFSAGEFIIFPPYYHIHYEKKSGVGIVYYLIHFSGTDVERFLSGIGFDQLPVKHTVGIVDEVVEEFFSIFSAYEKNSPFIQEIGAIGTQKILTLLSLKNIAPEKIQPPFNAVYYIKHHLTQKISVSKLAELEGISESRFYAVFKEKMGCSPIDYVNKLRIDRACNLLTSSPMSVSEIGNNCGFYDNFYFSRIFKKCTGMTPTEYKKYSNEF